MATYWTKDRVELLNRAGMHWQEQACPNWRNMDVDEVNAVMARNTIPLGMVDIDHQNSKYLPTGAIDKLIPLAHPKDDRGHVPIFEKTLGCGFTHQALRYQLVRLVIITPNVCSIQRKQEAEGEFDDRGNYHPTEETSHVGYYYAGSVNSNHTKTTFYCTPDWFFRYGKNLVYDVIFIDEYHRYVTDGSFRWVCNSRHLPKDKPILGITATNLGGFFDVHVVAKSINAQTPKVTYKINRNTPNSNIDYYFNQFLNEGEIVKNELIIVTSGQKVIDLLAKAKRQGLRAWCNVGGLVEEDLKRLKDRSMIAKKIEEADFFIGTTAGTEGYDITREIDTASVKVFNNKEEYIRSENIVQATGRFRRAKKVICQVNLMGDGVLDRVTKTKIERWQKEATEAQNLKKEHQKESKGILYQIQKNEAYEIGINHPLLIAETERKGINEALGVRETKTNVRCSHKPKTDDILIDDHEHIVPRTDDSEEDRKKYIRRCIKKWNKKDDTKKDAERSDRWALLNLAYIDYDTKEKGLPKGHFLTTKWGVELEIDEIEGCEVMRLKNYKPINEVGADCKERLVQKYKTQRGVYKKYFNARTKSGTYKNALEVLLDSAQEHVKGKTTKDKRYARAYRAITYCKNIGEVCRFYSTEKDKTGKWLKDRILKNFDNYVNMDLCFEALKGVLRSFEAVERFKECVIEQMYLQTEITEGIKIGNRDYNVGTRVGGTATDAMCDFIFDVSTENDIKSCASTFLMAVNGVQPRCPYLTGSYRERSKKRTNILLNMDWKLEKIPKTQRLEKQQVRAKRADADYQAVRVCLVPKTKGGPNTLGETDLQEVGVMVKPYSIYNTNRPEQKLEDFVKIANIENDTKRAFISKEVLDSFKIFLFKQSNRVFPVKFFHFYTYYEKRIFNHFKDYVKNKLAIKMGEKPYKVCFSRLHDGYRVTALYGVSQELIDKIANDFFITPDMLGIENPTHFNPFNPFTLGIKTTQEEQKPTFKPVFNFPVGLYHRPPESPLKRIKKGYKFLYHYNPPDD